MCDGVKYMPKAKHDIATRHFQRLAAPKLQYRHPRVATESLRAEPRNLAKPAHLALRTVSFAATHNGIPHRPAAGLGRGWEPVSSEVHLCERQDVSVILGLRGKPSLRTRNGIRLSSCPGTSFTLQLGGPSTGGPQ